VRSWRVLEVKSWRILLSPISRTGKPAAGS
jgi:hypothetical protein